VTARRRGWGHVLPWRSLAIYLAAVLLSLYLLAPFSWLVLTSVMRESEALSVPPHWIPHEPTLANYRAFLWPDPNAARASTQAIAHVLDYFRNSLVVAVTVSLLNLVCGSMAAYALARVPFRGSAWLVLFYLASRMVPAVALMIPLFLVINALDLLDTVLALIITYTTFTLPFTIWIRPVAHARPAGPPGQGARRSRADCPTGLEALDSPGPDQDLPLRSGHW